MKEIQECFTLLEIRAVMKIFLQGKSAVHIEVSQTLGKKCPFYITLKTWTSRFRTGHFTVEDDARSGRPPTSSDPAICNAVHEVIFEYRILQAYLTSSGSVMGLLSPLS